MKAIKKVVELILSYRFVRTVLKLINRCIASFCSTTYLFSIPYHWVAFFSYMREQRAVLRGRARYYAQLGVSRSSRAELRRNIHRIEKGLLMRPRREMFARSYILETVEWYRDAVRDLSSEETVDEDSELVWAENVLRKYFEVVTDNKLTIRARELFQSMELVFVPRANDHFPKPRLYCGELPTIEEFESLCQYRRSVRWYEEKSVERDIIDRALMVARQSPSACNRLPYQFRIFDEPELARRIASIPFGTNGYADNVPAIAVVIGKLDSYFSSRDRHVVYIDSSLAAMSFIYALELLGVSSCVINWPDFEPLEMKMQRELNLDFSDRVIMLIAFGYADPSEEVAYSQKKPLTDIRRYNFE